MEGEEVPSQGISGYGKRLYPRRIPGRENSVSLRAAEDRLQIPF